MKRIISVVKRSTVISSVVVCLSLGLAMPLLAADPPAAAVAASPPSAEKKPAAAKPSAKCLSDLRDFDKQMEKDGYWRVGSGYGYGYPMDGLGYGYGYSTISSSSATSAKYLNARPGYEVRVLISSANILARHGLERACEDTLAAGRKVYKAYVADMEGGKISTAQMPKYRQEEIAAAKPVTDGNASFRSDQLVGTEVRNSRDDTLGSVTDIVMSPQSGKIAYLIVGRGGIFGIDEKYVPVPWADFKTTPAVNLLVLETDKTTMEAAPLVSDDQFAVSGNFDQEAQKVDAYWKAHLTGAVRK